MVFSRSMIAAILCLNSYVAAKCTRSYPMDGDSCGTLQTWTDGQNCWADGFYGCMQGCGVFHCRDPGSCTFGFMGVKTYRDCIWPTAAQLCCIKAIGEGANKTIAFVPQDGDEEPEADTDYRL